MEAAELRSAVAEEMRRVVYGSAPVETALYGFHGDEPDEQLTRLLEWLRRQPPGIGWTDLERRGNAPPGTPS